MNRSDFRELCRRGFVVLDGATGTELIKRGMPSGVSPELWVYEHPQSICDIHDAYIAAGSNIVYAPTFGGNRLKMAEFGIEGRLHEIVSSLVRTAKENAGERALVFGDIAPTGRFVEPFGDLPFEEAVAVFREAAQAMLDGGVDGFAIETMMDIQEARAALLGVREAAPELPVIVTMTFESSGRTLTGSTPEAALVTLQALGADAFGCNCSTGPEEMAKAVSAMRKYARIPLIAKPNAGLPRLENGRTLFSLDAVDFGKCAGVLTSAGAQILGGCCGTTPEHIGELAGQLKTLALPEKNTPAGAVVSSVSGVCETGKSFTVIGERINPTGKKAFQAELREGKLDMMMDFAVQQSSAGAQILDVNMGLSGIDEVQMMRKAVSRLVKSISLPLCVDSTDPDTVEAALRIYPGRALLNSISAERVRLEKVLPIAAKYGAVIIALPLTDAGIPATAAERMQAVEKIISEAQKYGCYAEDIIVDALIMAVASDPLAAKTALEVIGVCSSRKIKTVCGLSNVSFGMPDRTLLNRTFLGLAMGQGLTAAIANPLFADLMAMVKAGDALLDRDPKMAEYTRFAAGNQSGKANETVAAVVSPDEAVRNCVLQGDDERITGKIDLALQAGFTPEQLLNDILIPAITTVGEKYEKKEFFLPQLISGADAMSRGTAYLEPLLSNSAAGENGLVKIILATVKGDIHDIGKNIVGTVLKNYGFEVIDLGKDVPPEVILDTAAAQNVKIIGLSALMTTTMTAMRETVELARKRGLTDLNFIVGGAVVDENFAREIGAFYAADPMGAVQSARRICGK
ncbi:MAG: 5-methyltetrahydrofolate--homocysteine methyltransferase [Lentisphaerae bacterium]|nr:5-methyltetrahydrofolate--homocysteine methyltransferase [Lentisphaerota bacterium]